jgi:hypothetical protein
VIELLGIFLLAGTVTSVAVINAVHRPYETRSDNPHDFDITAVEAYNRILAALSNEKIGAHDLKLKETVDPLYVIANLSYQDEIGNKCDAQVTFDVVEGYKGTTTIRWSCKFLRWCERSTAHAVEQLLDEWIESCLGSQRALQTNAISKQLPTVLQERTVNESLQPANINQIQSKQGTSPIQQLGFVSQQFQKKLRKPPSGLSPAPQQFQVTLEESYRRVNERLMDRDSGKIWTLKEQIEDAFIVAQLNYRADKSKHSDVAIVNIDFSTSIEKTAIITWSCEFKQWCDESTTRQIQQFINSWITDTVSDSAHAERLEQTPSVTRPVVEKIRSSYPREFAYLKVMQRISSAPEKNTKWKLVECNQGNSIIARAVYSPSQNLDAVCNVELTIFFEEDASAGVVKCVYHFSPDCDINTAQVFLEVTQKWMEAALR